MDEEYICVFNTLRQILVFGLDRYFDLVLL